MHVLIFGASGKTGRLIVTQALERGWQVSAFVRDPARLGVKHERLSCRTGDMQDAAQVAAAFNPPCDAVISALGTFSKEPTTAMTDATRGIVAAMRTSGCRRIVIVSSLGAGDSAGQGNLLARIIQRWVLREVLIDKTAQEQLLAASGLEWTSLRPPQLTDEPRIRDDLVAWSGPKAPRRRLRWKVSRASVARYALDALEKRLWVGEAVALAEPA